MSGDDLKLVQGTLDVLVLSALSTGPKHGYGVAEWVRETTDETLSVEDGALYTSLHRMEERRWLESRWGLSENKRRAKFYRLTASGWRQLERHSRTWRSYADAVSKVLAAGRGAAGDG